MKGATSLLSGMNRQMNLPALQRIAMEFERENDIMDQRQEMMDDAIDDVTGLEDEEEGEEVINQVLDEIGVDLKQAVSLFLHYPTNKRLLLTWLDGRDAIGIAEKHHCGKSSCTGDWRWWRRGRRRSSSANGEPSTVIASRSKNFVLIARAFGVRFIGKHATSARGQSLLPVTALYGIETGFWFTSAERMSDARPSEFLLWVE
jgi:hypothetical protein